MRIGWAASKVVSHSLLSGRGSSQGGLRDNVWSRRPGDFQKLCDALLLFSFMKEGRTGGFNTAEPASTDRRPTSQQSLKW